jgi:uncharacterized protein DUF3800
MYMVYVDESGDSGHRGSKSYALGAVIVDDDQWPSVFDDMIDYRRFLRAQFNVPVRAEIKANYLLNNTGTFRKLALSERARFGIYRGLMRLQPKLDLRAFGVVVKKADLQRRDPGRDPREIAWEYFLQRIERMTTKNSTTAMLMHDEGDANLIRKLARKARRAGTAGSAFGTGTLRRPATLLLDDPVSRQSSQSYFLQLADLNAYAAFRHVFAPPARRVQICPQNMWEELGSARYKPVSALSGGPEGLVVVP